MNTEKIIAMGRAVIETEARAVADLGERIDAGFVEACRHMLHCTGRVVVTGMGKSGHIGSKIAATLASTGTPAFFVHPGEAGHGDLGMITATDVVIAISNSGETDELLTIVPLIKRLGVPLIAMTGRPASTLAREAEVHLDISAFKEACPLDLAPTSSTTATLAMGDALAIALMEERGFTPEDFGRSHPGGSLGRRLLLRVRDVMHTGARLPAVGPEASLDEALAEMTAKGLGMTAVVDGDNRVLGVFTDGDIRRTLATPLDPHGTAIRRVMTEGGKSVEPDMLAAEAVTLMQNHSINGLLVLDGDGRLVGALNMLDLVRAGVV